MIFNIYNVIGISIITFYLGYFYSNLVRNRNEEKKLKEYKKGVNKIFDEVLYSLNQIKTSFHSRLNNTISILTTTPSLGKINIVYLLDKNDIAIFQNDKCIYTSDLVDDEIIKSIIITINVLYKKDIEDVIDFMGIIYSKKDFESKFGIKVSELNSIINSVPNVKVEKSDIESIVDENESKFNMDDILDRINKIGIENLTKEEKEFLNNYKK